ncbi:hypothetical protein OR263_18255 [Streptomyces sp. NEAU-H22]|nr:hypothetical protein [Streptomyces sp. NEAU-H22]MCX3288626.1 hypothetical protein [Streptomyces sp. NEAU-H22]
MKLPAPEHRVRELLVAPAPGRDLQALVAAANAAGGPDNVGCVVADVLEG